MDRIAVFFKIAFACLALSSLTSCGGSEDSDLTLTFGSPKAYVVEAPAYSCYDLAQLADTPSLSANTFAFLSGTLSWKNTTSTVSIYAIKFTFTNKKLSDGDVTCVIAGDELAKVLGSTTGTMAAAASEAVPTVLNTACAMKCGSIPLANANASFEIIGKYEVIAIATDKSTGEQRTAKAKGNVSLLH